MEVLTERLRLREFTQEDINFLAEYRQDRRYLEFYYREPYARDECEIFVRDCIGWSREIPRKNFQLAITTRPDGILLGNCGVRSEGFESLRGDVGFELSPVYWGQGYATEAAATILQVGFDELDLNKIEARCVVANKRSVRLLRRLGFEVVELVPPGPGRGVFKDQILPERYVFLLSRGRWLERESAS